jgi:hypothetical protein
LATAHADDRAEYHFGFLAGTAVGEVGEKEAQYRLTDRYGKRAGSYNMASHKIEAEFVPARSFGLSLGSYFTQHHIGGVPELSDRHSGRFDGLSLGLKYQLLDRAQAPFGLAIEAEPQWRRVDGTSGEPVNEYGGQYWLMLDKELIANRILSVFNLVYEPEASQSRVTGLWSHESKLRVGGGLLAVVAPQLSMGVEGRYLLAFDGLGLDRYAGHAFFVGPTVSVKLAEKYWLLATWNIQVAGRSVEESGWLNLKDFERHQVRFKFGVSF